MKTLNRRQLFKAAGVSAAALALAPSLKAAQQPSGTPQPSGAAQPSGGPYQLPPLPYPYDALEPHIDGETMHIHHDKHHQAYVDNLNKAVQGHAALAGKPVQDLLRDIQSVPEAIRQKVVNNGGGHANHSMFWVIMGKNGGRQPTGGLAKAIDERFGSFDKFQHQLSQAALDRFGSGWAWLILDRGNQLQIINSANQDSPYLQGQFPVMGIDVWEHAYYLKYKNRRADYVKAWWNVVNWDAVAQRYENARRQG